jgi:hypothetical protein
VPSWFDCGELMLLYRLTRVAVMFAFVCICASSVFAEVPVVGAENYDYALRVDAVMEHERFDLEREKPVFLLGGCNLIQESSDRIELAIADAGKGAILTIYAPEAGRHSCKFSPSAFAEHINATLKIKAVTTLVFENSGGVWSLAIGQGSDAPQLYLMDHTKSAADRLKYSGSGSLPFTLNLENYTLRRAGYHFEMHHPFEGRFIDLFGIDGIAFDPEEITLRTYETRLTQAFAPSLAVNTIYVGRTPPKAIIGNILRFGSISDGGNNLATVRSVDSSAKTVKVALLNPADANAHKQGQWLRAFCCRDYEQVVPNRYPVVYLPYHDWSGAGSVVNSMARTIATSDPTGLFSEIDISGSASGGGTVGFRLKNVTYGYDGINFVGGLLGVVDFGVTLDFMGEPIHIGPVAVDVASFFDQTVDELLYVNTYDRNAWCFHFNPDVIRDAVSAIMIGPTKYKKDFPLRFRLYFDRNFRPRGGTLRLRKHIPISPMVGVDYIGGGFSGISTSGKIPKPESIELELKFGDNGLAQLPGIDVPFWELETRAILAMDEGYLRVSSGRMTAPGSGMNILKKVKLGSAAATIQWDRNKRPKGKRWEGIVFNGRYGIDYGKVDVVFKGGFRFKRWPRSTYIGGNGSVGGEAFGVSLGSASAWANRRRLKFKVKSFGFSKSVVITWSRLQQYITPASSGVSLDSMVSADVFGVDRFSPEDGVEIIFAPNARLLGDVARRHAVDSMAPPATPDAVELRSFDLSQDYYAALVNLEYRATNTPSVSVVLPNGTTNQVVIADTDADVENAPGTFAGVDYATNIVNGVESEAREMVFEIPDAEAGTYTLRIDASNTIVDAVSYFEVIPVPEITNMVVTPVSGRGTNRVMLSWQTDVTVTNCQYQLSLQKHAADGTVERELPIYGMFEEQVDEPGEEPVLVERQSLLSPDEITYSNGLFTVEMELPLNLGDGNYCFVLDPVVTHHNGVPLSEILYGVPVASPLFGHSMVSPVPTPGLVTAQTMGNGLIRVQWEHTPNVDGWSVSALYGGAPTGSVTLTTNDLASGKNQISVTNGIPPLQTVAVYDYLDIGQVGSHFPDRCMIEFEYGKAYTFEVRSVRHETGYWTPTNLPVFVQPAGGRGYHDLNIVEARAHDGILTFVGDAMSATATAVEPQPIRFTVLLETDGVAKPVFSTQLFEDGNPTNLQYDVDSDIVTHPQRPAGWAVLRADKLDRIKLEADIPFSCIGISMRSAVDGSLLFALPPLDLAEAITAANTSAFALQTWLTQNMPPSTHANITALLNADIFSANATNVVVSMVNYMTVYTPPVPVDEGRFLVSVEAYNDQEDVVHTAFSIHINQLQSALQMNPIQPGPGAGEYTIGGICLGAVGGVANALPFNVDEWGAFEVVVTPTPDPVQLVFSNEFGHVFSNTIPFAGNQYVLHYSSPGGSLVGSASQTVVHGSTGTSVSVSADPGALFMGWDDGNSDTNRIDGPITWHTNITALFETTNRVSVGWYAGHQLSPTGGQHWGSLDLLDPDGDGLLNKQEFIVNSDPNDSTSRFRAERIELGANTRVFFHPEAEGRQYTLEFTSSLTNANWQVVGTMMLDPDGTNYVEGSSVATAGYYRVLVEMP